MKYDVKNMYYFLKVFNNESEDFFIFTDILSDVYGKHNIIIENNLIFINKVYNRQDIMDLIESFSSELYLNVICFVGENKTEEYLQFIKNKLNIIKYNSNYRLLDESQLIRNCMNDSVDEETKKIVLKEFYLDNEMKKTIKAFLECNMNTLKTSEILYMHRNTLINRINKFIHITNYDVKNFKDAVVIYHMLK